MKTDAELRHFDWSCSAGSGHEFPHVMRLVRLLPVFRIGLSKPPDGKNRSRTSAVFCFKTSWPRVGDKIRMPIIHSNPFNIVIMKIFVLVSYVCREALLRAPNANQPPVYQPNSRK